MQTQTFNREETGAAEELKDNWSHRSFISATAHRSDREQCDGNNKTGGKAGGYPKVEVVEPAIFLGALPEKIQVVSKGLVAFC
jgi:hypothetical protein